MLIGNFYHNLFTFLPFDYHLPFHSFLSSSSASKHFKIKTTKIVMRLMLRLHLNEFIRIHHWIRLNSNIHTDCVHTWYLKSYSDRGQILTYPIRDVSAIQSDSSQYAIILLVLLVWTVFDAIKRNHSACLRWLS